MKVVAELPDELISKYDHNITNIPHLRVEAWAPAKHYLGEVYPVLQEQGYVMKHSFLFFHFLLLSFISSLN